MIESYRTASDELYGQIATVVNSNDVNTLLAYNPLTIWPNTEPANAPDAAKVWLRVTRQGITNPQTAFGNSYVNRSNRKHTNYGLLFVDIFIPKTPAQLSRLCETLADWILKRSFRNKSTEHCIIFRNARISEPPPEDDWFRLRVITEYEYDEIS